MAESNNSSIEERMGNENNAYIRTETTRQQEMMDTFKRYTTLSDDGSEGVIQPNTAFSPNDPRHSYSSRFSRSLSQTLVLPQENGKNVVVVLGGGDFGRALTTQLVHAGYHVVVASRNPDKASERLARSGGIIMSQSEGLSKSPLVFVTIPSQHHSSLPVPALQNKVLIDVSNRAPEDMESPRSNAENLQMLIPSAVVVKGFNNLSAYALERNLHIGKEVFINCDLEWPADLVATVARKLGLQPITGGSLDKCRELEKANLRFFPEWKFSFILVMTVFWIMWILVLFRDLICPNISKDHTGDWDWSGFTYVMICTAPLGVTAVIVLALTYLPGVLAAYIQLYRGTKYSEFPKWLDTWLLNRKYLGLSVLVFAYMHAFGEILLSSVAAGAYFRYTKGGATPFDWQTPTFVWFGMMTLALLLILGITSLPSVSKVLTWKEFIVIQSKLGWVSLVFATVHIITVKWNSILKSGFTCYFIPKPAQIAIVLPLLTIILKLPLLIPPVNYRLTKIRRGFDVKKSH